MKYFESIRSYLNPRLLFAPAIIAALLIQSIGAGEAGAIGGWYFDRNDTNSSSGRVDVDLAIGETRYVQRTGTRLKVYFPTAAGGSLTIRDFHYCPAQAANADLRQAGDGFNGSNLATGSPVTRFYISGGTGAPTTILGRYYPYTAGNNATCDENQNGSITFALGANEVALDPSGSGMYQALIEIDRIDRFGGYDGIMNLFSLRTSAGAYIGQLAGSSGNEVTVEQRSTTPEYMTYYIRFGSDCSVTSARTARVYFYDLDNAGGSGAQPPGNPISMRLWESNYDGSGQTNVPLNGDLEWTPPTNDNAVTDATFTARPGKRYEVAVYSVYNNNTLQFSTPFDGIFYVRECNPPPPPVAVVTPISTVDPTGVAQVGSNVDATMQLRNVGNAIGRVTYTRTMWYEKDGLEAGGAVYNAGTDELIGAAQTAAADIPINTTRDFGVWRSAQAITGRNITHICALVSVVSRGAPTTIGAPNPSVACVAIGKRPHLNVENGDLYAGGTFASVNAACTVPTGQVMVTSNRPVINATNYSSLGTYGVTSLGRSFQFASNDNAYIYGVGFPVPQQLLYSSQNQIIGSRTYDGYFYGTTANVNRCLSDPFTTFRPKAQGGTISGGASSLPLNINSLIAQPGATVGRYVPAPYAAGSELVIMNPSNAQIPAGKKIIIDARGRNVRIANSIQYSDGPYASTQDLPQLVILTDGDITIDGGVQRIDGVLAARGDLFTCNEEPTMSRCNQLLEVNGLVVVGGRVQGYRSFGAEDTPPTANYATPAEIFRLRPDSLLNMLPGPNSPDVFVRTVDEVELPARY